MSQPLSGKLPVTLATWFFILDARGHSPADPALAAALKALADAADADAAGRALVDQVAALLGSEDAEAVSALLQRLYPGRVGAVGGADRAERGRNARRYQFSHNLPWIAEIIDRAPDGRVGAHWVMVEELMDVARIMDPFPWDDVDEEILLPFTDFMVKWELAGARSFRFE